MGLTPAIPQYLTATGCVAIPAGSGIPPSRGGTGLDTSAANGIPSILSGSWSVAPLTAAQLGSGTPGAGKYVDGATGAWTTLPSGGGSGSNAWLYGDGSDGAVHWTTNQTLTRPWFCASLTVDSGVVVDMGNNPIYVQGTASVDGAIFRCNGNNASGVTAGTVVGSGGTVTGRGGPGGVGGAAGVNGGSPSFGASLGVGGAGGNGSVSSGGIPVYTALWSFRVHSIMQVLSMAALIPSFGASNTIPVAGIGGGGGGGAPTTYAGGGGGGGAGTVMLFFAVCSGSFTMLAIGGNGAAGLGANAGGGGAGSGGFCCLVTATSSPSVTQTVTPGSPGASGGGTATAGGAGASGLALILAG